MASVNDLKTRCPAARWIGIPFLIRMNDDPIDLTGTQRTANTMITKGAGWMVTIGDTDQKGGPLTFVAEATKV